MLFAVFRGFFRAGGGMPFKRHSIFWFLITGGKNSMQNLPAVYIGARFQGVYIPFQPVILHFQLPSRWSFSLCFYEGGKYYPHLTHTHAHTRDLDNSSKTTEGITAEIRIIIPAFQFSAQTTKAWYLIIDSVIGKVSHAEDIVKV